jgi:hypothetical protein
MTENNMIPDTTTGTVGVGSDDRVVALSSVVFPTMSMDLVVCCCPVRSGLPDQQIWLLASVTAAVGTRMAIHIII